MFALVLNPVGLNVVVLDVNPFSFRFKIIFSNFGGDELSSSIAKSDRYGTYVALVIYGEFAFGARSLCVGSFACGARSFCFGEFVLGA